jgi:hypothetical protein
MILQLNFQKNKIIQFMQFTLKVAILGVLFKKIKELILKFFEIQK